MSITSERSAGGSVVTGRKGAGIQHPVELILLRQLASHLTTPMFVVDAAGSLVYYNDAAAPLLGRDYEDADLVSREAWLAALALRGLDGAALDPAESPLVAALATATEQHRSLMIRTLDGGVRRIHATAIPLVGQAECVLGAVAIFWPADRQ